MISLTIYIPLVKAHALFDSLLTRGYLSASRYSRFLIEEESFPGTGRRSGWETNGPYLEAWIMGWWIRFSVGHSLQGTNWLQDRGADPAYGCEILGWDGAFYILNSMPLGETCTLQFSMASPRQCISVLYLSSSHIYMACLATVSSWSSWPIML